MLKKEKKKFLNNNWYLVGSKNEFLKKNDFKTLEIFNEPIIVYNTGNGIKVFKNICPHRGSKIKLKNRGNEVLRCEYHGWCFDKEGNFLSAPFVKFQSKKKVKLKKWRIETFNDLIFISSEKNRTPLKKYFNKFNKDLNNISKNIGHLVHSRTYNWNCNWKVAIENSIDEYHAPFLHKTTFKNVLKLNPTYHLDNKILSIKMPLDKKYLNSIEKFKNSFLITNNQEYTHVLFFPFTTFASTMGVFNFLQTYLPVNEKLTKVTTNIFINFKNKKKIDEKLTQALINLAINFNQTVFEEDKLICENINFEKKIRDNNIFTEFEKRVKKFRDLSKV